MPSLAQTLERGKPQFLKFTKPQRRRIVKAHRGLMTDIARTCRCSQALVTRVLYNEAKAARVAAEIDRRFGLLGLFNHDASVREGRR